MLGVCLQYKQKNYGSKLQALATVRMLEEIGLEYEIIQYNKRYVGFYLKSLPRLLNPVFLNDRYCQIQHAILMKRHPSVQDSISERNKAFDAFDTHFVGHNSPMFRNYQDLKRNCAERYSQVLTCSDQLWSPSSLASGFYNLLFVPGATPKISWASSFGVNNIPWYQRIRTRKYLRRIEHISMRENRGAEIVKELTDRDVPVLMDPVFVFTREEWDEIIPPAEPEWENYIFCYFLGDNPEHRTAAKKLAAETGMKIVTLRHLDVFVDADESFGDYAPYDVDPVRFLNILRNATFVCTDSFHGTAFSVIFEKQFVVFDRYKNDLAYSKNSRIESVCKNLGLNDRRYIDVSGITEQMAKEIAYDDVCQKYLRYREDTKKYLNEYLKK